MVVATDRFSDDLAMLLDQFGFRVDVIFPADSPSTAIVSGHGVRLRLESSPTPRPVILHLLTDEPGGSVTLPGGSVIEPRPLSVPFVLPANQPSLLSPAEFLVLDTFTGATAHTDSIGSPRTFSGLPLKLGGAACNNPLICRRAVYMAYSGKTAQTFANMRVQSDQADAVAVDAG